MNNKGNVTLLGLLVMLLISSYLIALILGHQNTISQAQNRADKYLCLKMYLHSSKKYISRMNQLNLAIMAAQASALIPATASAAKAAIKGFKITQDIIHFSYLKKLHSNKHCSKTERFLFLTKLPYKTDKIWKLKRNLLQITQIRQKKWTIFFRLKNGVTLLSKISVQAGRLRSTTQELPSWRP